MREVADLRRQLAKHELDEVSLSETNAALRKSEAQFGRIFQQSPICLAISDIESGEIFRVNDFWCKTFGYAPEEAIGKTTVALDLLGPVDSNREAFLDVLKKDGKVRNVEARMQTKDRQILTVLYSCDTIEYEGATRLYTTITDITQRANSEQLFAVAFEANPEFMTISSVANGRLINANRRFLDYYGFSKQDVVGKDGEELDFWADPEDRKNYSEALQRHSGVRDYPIRMRWPDGGMDYFRFSTDTIILDGIAAFLTVGRRVTDEVAAKQALNDSEELFRLLLEAAPVPLFITADGVHKFANNLACKILGRRQEQLIGQPTTVSYVNQEDRDDILSTLEREGEIRDFNGQFKRMDGSTFWAEVSATKVIYQGRPANLIGMHDVTERRALEEALRLSEARFQDFAEIGSDWLWEMNADLRYIYFSDRLEELTGILPDRSLGRTRQQAVRGNEEDKAWRQHLDDLENQRPFRDFRYTYTRDDDRILHWSVSGKPVYDDNGEFQSYRGTGTYLTAEVVAQERAANFQQRFVTAVEQMPVAFALYDQDDCLVHFNERYGKLNNFNTELAVLGATFESILRANVASGFVKSTGDDPEVWIKERLERHRNPSEPMELSFGEAT